MCYFKDCKVVSDKKLLKRDGIVAYKKVHRLHPGVYMSAFRGIPWLKGRMTLQTNQPMFAVPNGKGPGIYAYKNKPFLSRYDDQIAVIAVKVLLYGRVIEYKGHYPKHGGRRVPGYMAEKAEIIEEVK